MRRGAVGESPYPASWPGRRYGTRSSGHNSLVDAGLMVE